MARLPAGSSAPLVYLPVSTPCATGDQTICEMPSSFEVGTTSSSMTRQSSEYSGWFETSWIFSSRARACASRSCSAFHSETPMYSTLPWRTRSANVSIVSSRGVSTS